MARSSRAVFPAGPCSEPGICLCNAGDEACWYVNVAWDGSTHAFILDPTVHPDFRLRGIGRQLVRQAVEAAGERGVTWVHVDFEPSLRGFYARCGFRATEAGVINVANPI